MLYLLKRNIYMNTGSFKKSNMCLLNSEHVLLGQGTNFCFVSATLPIPLQTFHSSRGLPCTVFNSACLVY